MNLFAVMAADDGKVGVFLSERKVGNVLKRGGEMDGRCPFRLALDEAAWLCFFFCLWRPGIRGELFMRAGCADSCSCTDTCASQ